MKTTPLRMELLLICLLPLGCAASADPADPVVSAVQKSLLAATPLAAVTCNGSPPAFVQALADFTTPCAGAGNCLTSVSLGAYANAVCNDGTPARMYVKSAPVGSPNANNWIIHLQGGGTCGTGADCRARWCGESPVYDASKMSTKNAPINFEGKGIFTAGAGSNRFADWNLVYVYYCSSDDWLGTNLDATLASAPVVGPLQLTRLSFAGYHIVNAVFDMLRAQAAGNGLPDLDFADQVLFAGSSSGGVGARNHADRIRGVLEAFNPGVDFRVIVDSAVKPNGQYISGALDNPSDDALPEWATVAAFQQDHHDKDAVFHPVLDESCTAIHLADPNKCADPKHVLFHHLSTPVFVRQALYEKMPDVDHDGPDVDPILWAAATRDVLNEIDDLGTTSEEGATIAVPGGAFGPAFCTHTSLDSPRFFSEKVFLPPLPLPLPPGGLFSEHDVLGNWLDGSPRAVVVEPSTIPPTCP